MKIIRKLKKRLFTISVLQHKKMKMKKMKKPQIARLSGVFVLVETNDIFSNLFREDLGRILEIGK